MNRPQITAVGRGHAGPGTSGRLDVAVADAGLDGGRCHASIEVDRGGHVGTRAFNRNHHLSCASVFCVYPSILNRVRQLNLC